MNLTRFKAAYNSLILHLSMKIVSPSITLRGRCSAVIAFSFLHTHTLVTCNSYKSPRGQAKNTLYIRG